MPLGIRDDDDDDDDDLEQEAKILEPDGSILMKAT